MSLKVNELPYNVSLLFKGVPGHHISEDVKDAIKLQKLTDKNVTLKFNDKYLEVKGKTPEEIEEAYSN